MSNFIPVNEPLLDGNEGEYLQECIRDGWISSEGPFVKRFEEAFAAYHNRKHAISLTNGTDALDVAVWSLDLAEGDEVILPSFTIISCMTALLNHGLKPVLVDCDPRTWNMSIDEVRAKITSKTKAIMPVHIYGLPVDMDPILALAEEHGLKVIEDTAEAIGLKYKGRPCGGMGDLGAFSFYANKHVTTGEGGMVVTDDDELAERCRWYRNLCFQQPRFRHTELGRNMRMTNIQAAVGLAQVERLDDFITKKRKMGAAYLDALSPIEGIQLPLDKTDYAENVYWVFPIVLDDDIGFDAEEAMQKFAEYKIGCRPFFWPMHEQPVLRDMNLFEGEQYPVSERIARRGFYIPSGLGITDAQIERVCDVAEDIFAR
ncbi:DegT/DnrJ/EryC1/StrS family aminotransferase [Magnetovibrio sp. PR-2]|uniref:DegT/DnrJ/EryC1/StrS family aminotransferase n=1 Tax=Magnetovibrio sp. PR-2 TaxID=3120356 RepID=UPI002FCDF914